MQTKLMMQQSLMQSRVRRTGTGNSRYREFFMFLVVSEPVSEKFGTGKKYRNRYRKNLVPEKKYRNRYRKNLVPEKISEPVSEKFGTGTDFSRQNLGILKICNEYRY